MEKSNSWGLAKRFHDLYEKYAPDFGYATREDTKDFDPESPNGKLITKVCNEVISQEKEKWAREIENLKTYCHEANFQRDCVGCVENHKRNINLHEAINLLQNK